MHPGPPLPSSPARMPRRPRPPVSIVPGLVVPHLSPRRSPCSSSTWHPPPPHIGHLLTPFFSPAATALRGAGRRRTTLSSLVKLVVAHYTPRCLLSKLGHHSIPEAFGRHRPPTVKVLALTSRYGRPPVPLSRQRAPRWLPSPPQPQADASKLSSGQTPVSPSAPTAPPRRRRSGESHCQVPCLAPPPCHTGTQTAARFTPHCEVGC
jgi:hypothetical protein